MNCRAYLAAALAVAMSPASESLGQHYPRPHGPYQAQCRPPYAGPEHDSTWYNLIWPRQYVGPSRRGICQAFNTMANNGWQRQNLLGPTHFDPDTDELSAAGKLKAEWILTQAPQHRRMINVERGADAEQTARRIESVQNFAANGDPAMGPAMVQETHLKDYGHPASSVDAVFTGFHEKRLPPVLPQPSATDSGSGQ